MNFGKFLKDEALFIFAYLLGATLTISVIELDYLLNGRGLSLSSILYIMLLEIVILAIFLFLGYQKKKTFYQGLQEISKQNDLAYMSSIAGVNSEETALMSEAWTNMYKLFSQRLQTLEAQDKRNLYFLSQWAHHMKTPVAVIDLVIQKSMENNEDVVTSETLLSIKEENDRLEHAISMLLNQVRLGDFTNDFKIEKLDPLEIARKVINDKKRDFIINNVFPRIEDDNKQMIESDAKWLRFVIEQILANAVKYSSGLEREGQITLRITKVNSSLALEVVDNGIGISKEDLNRVFEPFYTGMNGRQYAKSTGLGLYLAREICAKLDHELQIESKKDYGTTVRIVFPQKRTIFTGLLTY